MITETLYKGHDECPICCDSMNDMTVSVTPCNHHFHTECLMKQFNSNSPTNLLCAICRTNLWNSLPENLQNNLQIDNTSDEGLWNSEVVELLVDLPTEPRGSRRTQLLLTRYVMAEDINSRTSGLSSNDRLRLNSLDREAVRILGEEDSTRINEFVNIAINMNQSINNGIAVTAQRDPNRYIDFPTTSLRDLSEFLADQTPIESLISQNV